MQIQQFRVALKARDFERTCRFYGEVLALPQLKSWDGAEGRWALYQAGSGAIAVLGRSHEVSPASFDEEFEYLGPRHKLGLELTVTSAENVYQELALRDRNIPGGLRRDGGTTVFETHDPDGVRIVFREGKD